MREFDGPEVARRERLARRRKLLLRRGIIVFYACIWLVMIVGILVDRFTRSGGREPRTLFFENPIGLLVFIPMLIPVLALALPIILMGRNPMRGMYYLPYAEPNAGPAVRRLRSAIESASIATGRPPLECLVMPSSMPNAMAVILKGKPYLVVTSGLLETDFSERELTALVAHEAAHIATGDALSWRSSSRFYLTTILCAHVTVSLYFLSIMLTGPVFLISKHTYIAVMIVFLPAAVTAAGIFLERLYSRQDDLFADSLAARVTMDPDALISVIKKIAASEGTIDFRSFGTGVVSPYLSKVPAAAAVPISAARYFFVNPLHRAQDKPALAEQAASRYMPLSADEILDPVVSGQTRSMFDRHRGEEKVFLMQRLMALEEIRRGHPVSTRGGKTPASQWE